MTPLRLIAAAWFIGFTVYFFSQGLPNASFTRPAFWGEATWQIVDALSAPPTVPGQPPPPPSGWRFLPQRFANIAWAAVVLIGAWHLGALLIHVVMSTGRRGATPPLTPGLHFPLAGLAGLSAWSLVVLALGLAGLLSRTMCIGLLAVFIALEWLFERRWPWRSRLLTRETWNSLLGDTPRLAVLCLVVTAPFLMAMALGSLLPSTDFDVKAYHLVGPKEWFEAGRIEFLEHNVYTSFPFLTEMLLLSTMVLRGDWFEGAWAGQLVLASFGLYAAMCVFQIAARFSRRAAWLAAFVYLTTPWVCRISIIAYVEGALAAFLAATLLCFLESRRDQPSALRWTILCGLFAGSAASCKYPGVISALIPFGCLTLWEGFRAGAGSRIGSALVRAAVFSIAGLAAFGPWLLKNVAQTGNPVYPLLWDLFGGQGFDAQLNAKFKAGHALPIDVLKNPLRWIPDLWHQFHDVAVGSDWQSPLMFGLAPAAVFVWWSLRRSSKANSLSPLPAGERARVRGMGETALSANLAIILLDAAWLFLTWWALTHRIDRFWVPMLPILAALAGMALDWILSEGRTAGAPLLKAAVVVTLAATTWYHLGFIASPLIGFNGYLMDLRAARRIAETPGMSIINSLPDDARVFLIGEAQVFEARRPVIYSTVFNRNVFEERFAADAKSMKSADEIRKELHDRGVTHVLVNWNEVLRYRTTYGYTDFVTPEHVHQLMDLGLVEPVPLPENGYAQLVAEKGDSTQFQLSGWGRTLVRRSAEGDWYPAYELWRVK
ncbi:MAG TPA: phospholipid carrier-dependent glycosyltransferase [Caulifigura sp.]|nr:phospholipid carrier-dependent glycosyltransferase [Caulifigura sp.]